MLSLGGGGVPIRGARLIPPPRRHTHPAIRLAKSSRAVFNLLFNDSDYLLFNIDSGGPSSCHFLEGLLSPPPQTTAVSRTKEPRFTRARKQLRA